MLRSMTAYSYVKKAFKNFEITCEIIAHNKRFLDIHLKLPSDFIAFEAETRKKISENISRGTLCVNVLVRHLDESPVEVLLDVALAKKLNQAIQTLALEIGCKEIPDATRLHVILEETGVLSVASKGASEQYQEEFYQVLNEAVSRLIEMKKREGEVLAREFQARLITLETIIEEIQQKAKGHTERSYTKLKELFGKLFPVEQADDIRLLKEIAIVAEKSDIAEEILRFSHHISQFRKMLESQEAQGKTFEFLLQELQREINTIGSKSQDVDIASLVIFAKSEIEKIREQIQNVE
jgi:uncharacterized protein (TIGR00255 family)